MKKLNDSELKSIIGGFVQPTVNFFVINNFTANKAKSTIKWWNWSWFK